MREKDLSSDEVACRSQNILQANRQSGTDMLGSKFPNEAVIIHRPSYLPRGYDKLLVCHPSLRLLLLMLCALRVRKQESGHFENKDDDIFGKDSWTPNFGGELGFERNRDNLIGY